MAIIPELPGLKVEVAVNGEPLKEFDDSEAEERNRNGRRYRGEMLMSTYIEAVTGAEFALHLTFSPPFSIPDEHGVEANIYVDGAKMDSAIFQKEQLFCGVDKRSCKVERRAGQWFKSPFHFLEITPGETECSTCVVMSC
jgi:hypothetical protein